VAQPYTENGTGQRNGGPPRRGPLGRVLGDSLGEVSQLLRLLPEVAHHLKKISRYTETMATEVRGMHAAVVRLEHEVQGLRVDVVSLDARMSGIEAGMGRLEPHIADVNLAMRPLRRARARLPQRSPGNGDAIVAPLDPDPPHGDPLS
jgi:hypothetical protein